MRNRVVNSIGFKLAYDFFATSAASGTFWVAALNHESFDDAMKSKAVIKSALNKILKILGCDWGRLMVQFQLDIAVVFNVKNNHFLSSLRFVTIRYSA